MLITKLKNFIQQIRDWIAKKRWFFFLITSFWALLIGFHALLVLWPMVGGGHARVLAETNSLKSQEAPFSYIHDEIREVPWSIHIAKIERGLTNYYFGTTLGGRDHLGMSTVSDQIKNLSSEKGDPVVAINGDFYHNSDSNPGDPQDLQVWRGEVVSAPSGHMTFWMDRRGIPHMTKVESAFHVVWPTGQVSAFGLNEERKPDELALYTAAFGDSTHTQGGSEITIKWDRDACAPFRLCKLMSGSVQSVSSNGNSRIPRFGAVLSVGEQFDGKLASVSTGMTLRISTETIPRLAGVEVALGGGPALVENGRAKVWSGLEIRHPRAAIGWNSSHIFLVEVDGRQIGLSAGMTFSELAAYMRKLGCDEAMNLDGGGSATMWVRGSVMNSPSEGHERPGANSLVLFRSR